MIVALFMIAGSNREEFNLDSLESARPESLDSLKDCTESPRGWNRRRRARGRKFALEQVCIGCGGIMDSVWDHSQNCPSQKSWPGTILCQGFRDHGNCHQVVTQALICWPHDSCGCFPNWPWHRLCGTQTLYTNVLEAAYITLRTAGIVIVNKKQKKRNLTLFLTPNSE